MDENEKIWNVVVPVVSNLRAGSGEEAARLLAEALERAGFSTLSDVELGTISLGAFEAETGTAPDSLEREVVRATYWD